MLADSISGSDMGTLLLHKVGFRDHAKAHWTTINLNPLQWVERMEWVMKPSSGCGDIELDGKNGAVASIETRNFFPWWFELNGIQGGGKTDEDILRQSLGGFCLCQYLYFPNNTPPSVFKQHERLH